MQMNDGAQSAQQQQMLSQMLIQKLQSISQIVHRSQSMEQHGGSSNNLGSLADNTSQSNISISSMAQQPQSRPMTAAYPPQSYQQLH